MSHKQPEILQDYNLTDHVWQFHSPKEIPKQEVIFFHGLQLGDCKDSFWETWVTQEDKQCVWPKEWLSKIFPEARILSVSYNSCAIESAGQLSMYALAENLYSDIILDREHKIGQNCPVFLVGHCFGGIVIKHFILFAKNRLRNDSISQRDLDRTNTFLNNFNGVFYYATPHGGSEVANLAARLLPGRSPILELVNTLNTDTAIINEEFSRLRKSLNARAFGMAEGSAFSYMKVNTFVVREASTRQDIDYFYTHSDADHFTVCKARHEGDPTVIVKLAQFIQDNVPQELKVQVNVGHQSEAENTSSPEEPQSYLGSATPKLSETVVNFISRLNEERLLTHQFCGEWWDKLEKDDTEALWSTFEESGYKVYRVSSTKMFCSRDKDNKQG